MRLRGVLPSLFFISISLSFSAHTQQSQFPWRFEEVVTLDTGVPEALVGDMGASTIDGSGRVSFLCLRTHLIYRFDSDGRWLGNIDRKGNGPGEFQNPLAISASYGGDLLIYDADTWRITHLTPDGEYVASLNVHNLINVLEIERTMVTQLALADSDHYWLTNYPLDIEGRGTSERVIALVDSEGRVVWSQIYEGVDIGIRISPPSRPSGGWIFHNPVAHDARWTADSNGSAWIISPDCRLLTVVDNTGEITREVPLQLPALRI